MGTLGDLGLFNLMMAAQRIHILCHNFFFQSIEKEGVSFKTGLLFMNPEINLEHF